MATKPIEKIEKSLVSFGTVKASNTILKGEAVKWSSGELVPVTAVTDNAVGIAIDAGNGDVTDSHVSGGVYNKIRYLPLGCNAIVLCLVGSAGATQGAPAKWGTTAGAIDATVGGGTTKLRILGSFVETGVSGDYVGLNVADASWSVGS